ncbi:MAG TPA: hypothetical protein VHS58_09385 [Acetobacteraceae bacterium]|jgi:hypothetical protein|nr:hypothetical protein [Acetobacteraceae bacterium]
MRRLDAPDGTPDPPRKISKDDEYVTITARSSRIVNVRKFTGKFYGCIHARSHYLHEDRGEVEFQTVLAPKLLKELDPMHLDRVITVDQPVLGPVPYIGGFGLELGLFSVKGGDLAGPYIDVLTSLADTAGVGSFTKALPFVGPLKTGLDLLLGNTDQAELEIGLDQGFQDLTTGTWVIIRAPKGTAGIEQLRLDPEDAGLVDANGAAWRQQPYVVFRIDGTNRRDDWMTIPDLKSAWDEIGMAAKAGRQDEAEKLFAHFEIVAKWSPDLVPTDAKRLVDKARGRLPQLQTERAVAKAAPAAAHPLGSFESLDLYGDARAPAPVS